MDTENQQTTAPVTPPQDPVQVTTPNEPKKPFPRKILIAVVCFFVLALLGIGYFLMANKHAEPTSVKDNKPTITVTAKPTAEPTAIPTTQTTNNNKYTSPSEKITFTYPKEWTATPPTIKSNVPGGDQFSLKSPTGDITINWVSGISGLGGACDDTVAVETGQGCPDLKVIDLTPLPHIANLVVSSGIFTTDGKLFQPFLAVQDKTNGDLTKTQRTMGYAEFEGKNFILPDYPNQKPLLLFSTTGIGASGPKLSKEDAQAWFEKPEVKEAKQILLSLTY